MPRLNWCRDVIELSKKIPLGRTFWVALESCMFFSFPSPFIQMKYTREHPFLKIPGQDNPDQVFLDCLIKFQHVAGFEFSLAKGLAVYLPHLANIFCPDNTTGYLEKRNNICIWWKPFIRSVYHIQKIPIFSALFLLEFEKGSSFCDLCDLNWS